MSECFFWYQPTRVVLDKGPLNGCVCECVFVHVMFKYLENWTSSCEDKFKNKCTTFFVNMVY